MPGSVASSQYDDKIVRFGGRGLGLVYLAIPSRVCPKSFYDLCLIRLCRRAGACAEDHYGSAESLTFTFSNMKAVVAVRFCLDVMGKTFFKLLF